MHSNACRLSILYGLGCVNTVLESRPPSPKSRADAQFDFALAARQPAQLAGLQPDPHTAGPFAGA
jgi:hypothetical protein